MTVKEVLIRKKIYLPSSCPYRAEYRLKAGCEYGEPGIALCQFPYDDFGIDYDPSDLRTCSTDKFPFWCPLNDWNESLTPGCSGDVNR